MLTLAQAALKYDCINHGDQRVFQFEIIVNVLVGSFRLMNTYVMDLRLL